MHCERPEAGAAFNADIIYPPVVAHLCRLTRGSKAAWVSREKDVIMAAAGLRRSYLPLNKWREPRGIDACISHNLGPCAHSLPRHMVFFPTDGHWTSADCMNKV
jgi:hypothetical protein